MTKKTETTAKTAASKVKAAAEENKIADRVAEGAREFVMRSTSTAKERADNVYETTQKYNADLEDMLVRAAKGYTNILGNIAEAAFVNVNRGINAAEKLAESKSLSEAIPGTDLFPIHIAAAARIHICLSHLKYHISKTR